MQQFDNFPEFIDHAGILDHKYKILDTIGEGRYAKVKVAIDIENNKKYAIKIMKESDDINSTKVENFVNEVKILASISHKNVVKLRHVSLNGVYRKPDGRTQKVLYYVMKIAEYGELYRLIEQTTNFPENIARYFFQQIIQGIEQIHYRQIAHRDIKPENILVDNKFQLIICDFGFATKYTDIYNNRKPFDSNIPVGSPEYNPPEISNYSMHANTHYYGDDMDLFASGLVLFQLIMRSPPFQTSHRHDPYYQRLCRKDKSAFWKIFQALCVPSNEFKDLIEKMLNEDPDKRLSLEEIKQHPWYLGETPTQEEIEQEMNERAQILIQQTREELEQRKIRKFQKENRIPKPQQYEQSQDPQVVTLLNQYKAVIDEINEDIQSIRHRKKLQKQENQLKQQNDLQQQQQFTPKEPIPNSTQQQDILINQFQKFSVCDTNSNNININISNNNAIQQNIFSSCEPSNNNNKPKSQRKLRSQEIKRRKQQHQQQLKQKETNSACSSSQSAGYSSDEQEKYEKLEQFYQSGSLQYLDQLQQDYEEQDQQFQEDSHQQQQNFKKQQQHYQKTPPDSSSEDDQMSLQKQKRKSKNRGRTYYPRYPCETQSRGNNNNDGDDIDRYREQ